MKMPSISNYVKLSDKNLGESVVTIIEPPKSDNKCRKILLRYGLILLAWVVVGSFLFYMTLVVKPSCHLKGSDEFWLRYKTQFGKNYTQEEDERRQCIFMANVKEMEIHNYLFQVGIESYAKEINMFSDFTPEELDGIKCFQGDMSSLPATAAVSYRAEATYPESMDWRSRGAVGEVKNQGHCGSCYAFSATGALEAQHFLKTGQLVSLSEQNLVDCSRPQGNNGCNGGNMINAFRYILENNGIDTEQQYPYEGQEGTCRFKSSGVGATIQGYRSVAASEAALQAAVADIGPVAVGIHATSNFAKYGTGIFEDDSCSSYSLNHAVLVVGFGSEGGKDYWIVKNSWGSGWGENGYIRMARNMGNMCGIASLASYPVV